MAEAACDVPAVVAIAGGPELCCAAAAGRLLQLRLGLQRAWMLLVGGAQHQSASHAAAKENGRRQVHRRCRSAAVLTFATCIVTAFFASDSASAAAAVDAVAARQGGRVAYSPPDCERSL